MEAALLHVVRAFVLALLSVGFLYEVGAKQIVGASLDARIPVTLCEALKLNNVVLQTSDISIVEDGVKAHHSALTELIVILDVQHLETAWIFPEDTPLGYENLEAKRIVDLDKPTETIPPGEIVFKQATGKYVCSDRKSTL